MPSRTLLAALGLTSLLTAGLPRPARAQAAAFAPIIQEFPSGITLNTTPVVSADRRYVRIGVNAQFTAIEGFNTYSNPLAAVGGAGGGLPPGLRGGGGGGGIGGGAGGGGGRVAAGMDGVRPGRQTLQGGSLPLIAWQGMGSPDASAILSGAVDLPRSPMIDDYNSPDDERLRVAPRTVKKSRKTAPRKRR